MKLKYELLKDSSVSATDCPYKNRTKYSTLIKVGSIYCQDCKSNKGHNKEENYVECNYDEVPKIYLASALFTKAEQNYNLKLYDELIKCGYEVFLPQEECEGLTDSHDISEMCKKGIRTSTFLVVNMEGTDVDSGTAWECGYANALNTPIIGLRTDFRQRGDDGGLNCMLSQNALVIINDVNMGEIINKIVKVINDYDR